jgi:2-polyprenyl-3-methyl-5-hydroxy-6-metoxy-1,4-benzoquinol methylase
MLDFRLTAGKGADAAQYARVVASTESHDMYREPDEIYYREQYWYWIQKALVRFSGKDGVVGLDLGCGQGRLTTLLAQSLKSGRVLGVDISAPALNAAAKYTSDVGIRNVEYRACPIREVLLECAAESVDVVMMTEVTFFHPQWRAEMDEIKRVLRPGGIMCVSFRPQYFDALCIARETLLEQVSMLLEHRQGNLYGGDVEFTWQTSREVLRLLREDLGFEDVELVGIGCCSGTGNDPHAILVRPSTLDESARRDLMRLEIAVGAELPDAGRYMLAVASKRHESHSR